MSLTPLVFVVGPSGVGKDDVCSWIKTRYNFHHIDIDQPGHFEAYPEHLSDSVSLEMSGYASSPEVCLDELRWGGPS
jgi:adenylate kinase family enzyme